MNMTYNEPRRFAEQDEPLTNFKDLASRTQIIEKGIYSTPLGFNVRVQVSLESLDDLVLQCEQDYYLNHFLRDKFEILQNDPELLSKVLRLTEIYLTVLPYNTPKATKAKQYAISCISIL